ncbi:carboxypeptidase s1 [Fusarium sporotrichioides]|uniref:Carboxypeptidase n=1 Tax=Fusarium sporotrichioides TaxID=5514 RepID=A0A395RLB7_FUSSP|nr:carboxypeptidase s1 [Fusarium sporotrichioides]
MLFNRLLFLLGSSVVAIPTRSGLSNEQSTEQHGDVVYNVYHHAATRSKLSFVKNSGICETTPGVNQYSGYLSVGEDANMCTFGELVWRGPGGSAQYGMFTQHGPCEILANGTEPSLRKESLNTHADVLYIDQPIGSGFSYGDGGKVNSTKACSPYVWKFLQLWFEAFTEYEDRQLSVFTESYGGHTGPEIVNYILDKNQEIKAGKTSGDVIDIVALSTSNPWVDAQIQEKANLDFALNNSYRSLINESLYQELLVKYETEVVPNLVKCDKTGTTEDCYTAYMGYLQGLEYSIWASGFDTYSDFILADIQAGGVRPPTHHEEYMQRADVQKAIGARVNFTETGDAKSFLEELSRIVQDGVQVLIWAGDSDYVCNWVGAKRVADAVNWSGKDTFSRKELQPYEVNGVEKANFKSTENLHYVRVFDAGHNVWWYQPETSLQLITQFVSGKGLSST